MIDTIASDAVVVNIHADQTTQWCFQCVEMHFPVGVPYPAQVVHREASFYMRTARAQSG